MGITHSGDNPSATLFFVDPDVFLLSEGHATRTVDVFFGVCCKNFKVILIGNPNSAHLVLCEHARLRARGVSRVTGCVHYYTNFLFSIITTTDRTNTSSDVTRPRCGLKQGRLGGSLGCGEEEEGGTGLEYGGSEGGEGRGAGGGKRGVRSL
ncbi:unnamed protein product [Danaus chrysippus]|uniref:(African queen) hypothetical protein n=1 Tax=Danaus chrysippus TaxID=151541 RepID=A0A8J2W8X5_9NEOP|nr:unnamed protein product [Danaus chrysippus]